MSDSYRFKLGEGNQNTALHNHNISHRLWWIFNMQKMSVQHPLFPSDRLKTLILPNKPPPETKQLVILCLLNCTRKAFHLLFTLRGLQHVGGPGGCLMLQREPSRCMCVCADIFYTSQQSSLPRGVVLFYEWALMQEKSDLNTDRCEKRDGWVEGGWVCEGKRRIAATVQLQFWWHHVVLQIKKIPNHMIHFCRGCF